MEVSRKERKELDALSKEVFGASSRWKKLVDHGYNEALMEDKEETLPVNEKGEGGGTTTVKVPVQATKNGGVKYVTKHHTVESVREFMLEQKKRFEEIRAQIKKHQDDIKAQREEEARIKQLSDENSGSAV